MDFDWNWGFGASPARSSVWCTPAGTFFPEKHALHAKTLLFINFPMIFHSNEPNMLLNQRSIHENSILDPIEFGWGYPKSMKWSFHDSICWKVLHFIDISSVCGMLDCPPGAVGARKFAGLWRDIAGCENRLGAPYRRCQKVCRPVSGYCSL